MSSRRASWITAAAVAALGFAVFANGLSNGLTIDDGAAITNAASYHPLDWRATLLTPGGHANVYRPLTSWTFAAQHALHGDHPFGYHLVNVLAHPGVAALVVLLAQALGLSLAAAGLAGVLFAVHPVHGEAVAAVTARAWQPPGARRPVSRAGCSPSGTPRAARVPSARGRRTF